MVWPGGVFYLSHNYFCNTANVQLINSGSCKVPYKTTCNVRLSLSQTLYIIRILYSIIISFV